MAPVTHLPDACLLALFRQMTPEDQIIARQVCPQWKTLVSAVTERRHSLFINLGRNAFNLAYFDLSLADTAHKSALKYLPKENSSSLMTEWNSLQPWGLLSEDELLSQQLPDVFPNITKLTVGFANASHTKLVAIANLLNHWRHQIISLTVLEDLESISTESSTYFFASINALSNLKSLTLKLSHLLPPRDLQVIGQLEEIHFSTNFGAIGIPVDRVQTDAYQSQFTEMLRQYCSTPTTTPLRSVVFVNNQRSPLLLEPFTNLPSHLRDCFIRLEVLYWSFNSTNLPLISEHFRSLTTLDLLLWNSNLHKDLTHLALLTNLAHLCLHFDNRYIIFEADQGNLRVPPLPQLVSLKALDLELRIDCPTDLDALNIRWTMPHLESIYFHFTIAYNFSHCGFELDFPEGCLPKAAECLRLVFHRLKRQFGPRLPVIKHNLENYYMRGRLGSAEELLAAF